MIPTSQDRANAEREIFDAVIPAEDWDEMSEEEYYDKIYQIDVTVEKLVRERLVEEAEEEEQTSGKKKKKK